MDHDLFQKAFDLFERARGLPAGDRRAWIERETAEDSGLREEVVSLLDAHEDGTGLRATVTGGVTTTAARPVGGDRIGTFRLLRELGTGGMGTVYLAEIDGDPGFDVPEERVAIKAIHPHLLGAGDFERRFLREAEIGKRVRHENVVRTYGAGVTDPGPPPRRHLVMEYVEGQTLRALLRDLGWVPEELCRHIGREVASALTAIHEAGAIHRDLKPENVLLTRDDVVKVMDLGVAHLADEAWHLSATGVFVGSLRYAAPEQLDGDRGKVGDRTDLHGLGILLYELATGRHPYAGGGMSEITARILVAEPPRLGALNPQVSAFFEEFVHRLMSKAPEDRFASAAEAHRVLSDGETSDWWGNRSKALRETTSRPLRRMRVPRETGIHGREAPLAALRDLYRRAAAGEGRVVLVQGEAGIGKTRLVDEFVARIRDGGEEPHILFGNCPPAPTTSATGAFSMAFREYFGESALPGALKARLGETPLLVPAFAALLRGEPPPQGQGPITGDAVHTLFVNLTTALARERPTVLIIDDLHFATEEGRGLFALLALAAADARILLIGTARRDLDEEWIAEIERLPHGDRLRLDRLGAGDLSALLEEYLGGEAPAGVLADAVMRKSDGNPYFAFEIVRGLKEGSKAGLLGKIEIPSTVTELILARIGKLDTEDRELLDAAACAGFEFDPRLLAEAIGRPVVPVLRHLARIERGHRLLRSAGRRFRFDHHQVRETLYESLPLPLRSEYHAALGETLLARVTDGAPEGADAAELCSHLLRGGLGEKARPFLPAALDHLASAGRKADAIGLIELTLDPGDGLPEPERVRLLIRAAALHGALGHRDDEGRAIREAARRADGLGDLSLLLESRQRLVWHHWSLAEYEPARTAAREALEFARRMGDRAREAAAFGDAGGIGNETGDFEEALAAYEHQAEVGRELGDRYTEVIGIANSGLSLQYLGRYAEAQRRTEESLAISEDFESPLMIALAMLNLGRLEALLGDPVRGRSLLTDCLPLLRSIGERRPEGYALHRLGEVAEQEGRTDDAENLYHAALELRRAIRYPTGIAETLLALGRLMLAADRPDEAKESLSEAAALAKELGLRGEEILATCQLTRLPGGDGTRACALLRDGGEKMRVADRMEAHFALYSALGDPSELRDAAALAEHLLEHAPPDRRDAMRIGVPILRAILGATR